MYTGIMVLKLGGVIILSRNGYKFWQFNNDRERTGGEGKEGGSF